VEFGCLARGRGISHDLYQSRGNDLIIGQNRSIAIKSEATRLAALVEVGEFDWVRSGIADRVRLLAKAFVVTIGFVRQVGAEIERIWERLRQSCSDLDGFGSGATLADLVCGKSGGRSDRHQRNGQSNKLHRIPLRGESVRHQHNSTPKEAL